MAKEEVLVTESLTTKYRPKRLSDLAGQDSAVTLIKGMVESKTFPSVILISGNSGCGKTTLSQMINRYVNCDTTSACGECASCKRTNHPDLAEMNIGDTRGIDDIRAITKMSCNMPHYKKRIILLDEAHQLTKQAASCLLVPLENPSNHTMFILATTNPEKLLSTIIGRCFRIELRPIQEEAMIRRLLKVAKLEGVDFRKIENGIKILETLTSLTNGQMRDALQMLEAIIFAIRSGEEINPKTLISRFLTTASVDVEKAAGYLLYAILSYDIKRMLTYVMQADSSRLLLSKTRWLINWLLEDYIGKSTYSPVSVKQFFFLQTENKIKINFQKLLVLQSVLTQAEITMNSASIDEKIIFTSALGDYIARQRNAD